VLLTGCHCLGRARVSSHLPKLPNKKGVHRGRKGSTSSSVEEHLGFWIDEAATTFVLADGTPLTVHRFDDHWVSATRSDTSYELNRVRSITFNPASGPMDRLLPTRNHFPITGPPNR
jgi:hypothetical protein